jgi:hypothetical protein
VTERKPPGLRHEDWIERQLRDARERGAFDNLPGFGKPLKNLDRPLTAESWAADWIEREGGDLRGLLPPMLALRRERAGILTELAAIPYEAAVRDTVEDFNHRLLDQYRRPMDGPLIPVGLLDLDEVLAAWRAARPAPPPPPPPAPERPVRWWQWRRRLQGRRSG